SANSVMRGRLDARRTLKSLVADLRLFFDFKFKAKYLAFISCLLEKPDLSVKTALKSIFRKSQVRSISEKFGLNLNAQIVCLSPSQWVNCFLEMLEVVPEKFHPS
ncbi:rRNA adenine N-6-methyltransferase family protein, partial [Bacteroides uniformis]|uniref:rRNA adenine N-6-methyltransferase family protein n=1 Tax=Bacteroides uniformis TaxID=820 RepID=UPI001E572D58